VRDVRHERRGVQRGGENHSAHSLWIVCMRHGQSGAGSLDGVLIVADPLHAQVGHADLLAADGAQLMVMIKANQPTLHDQVKALPRSKVPIAAQARDTVTAVRRPARPRRSPSRPRAGGASPTHSRLSGSPGPARSRTRPAARRRTCRAHYPPGRPGRPIRAHGHARNRRSRIACTMYETSRSVKTRIKPGPATAPPCSRPSVTPQSGTTLLSRVPPRQRRHQHRRGHPSSQPPPPRPHHRSDHRKPTVNSGKPLRNSPDGTAAGMPNPGIPR
jgi:hypothetical protein